MKQDNVKEDENIKRYQSFVFRRSFKMKDFNLDFFIMNFSFFCLKFKMYFYEKVYLNENWFFCNLTDLLGSSWKCVIEEGLRIRWLGIPKIFSPRFAILGQVLKIRKENFFTLKRLHRDPAKKAPWPATPNIWWFKPLSRIHCNRSLTLIWNKKDIRINTGAISISLKIFITGELPKKF